MSTFPACREHGRSVVLHDARNDNYDTAGDSHLKPRSAMTTDVDPKLERLQMANKEVHSFQYLQQYQQGNHGQSENGIDIAVDIQVNGHAPKTI